MQKNKTILLINEDATSITAGYMQALLQTVSTKYALPENSLIHQAASLAQFTGTETATTTGQSCLQQGLHMAEILFELNADQETLACALLYCCVRYAGLNLEEVNEQLGNVVAKLIKGVKKMDAIQNLHDQIKRSSSKNAIDNLRKMLLAMVDDVRIVLIKLAERLTILRYMQIFPQVEKYREAKITLEIYAPLANRLGIGHLKWELEDLSFRYLQPEIYKDISKALKSTRHERETYVHKVIYFLKDSAIDLGVQKVEVAGRAKHIYSIYRKMTRKNVPMEEIYDVIAFRVLVPTLEDCYSVLGYIHALWKPIPKEFDDYITKPKPNGYRSIHTAVIGPDSKIIEVQIRTFQMHEEAEMGVAAHWIYKEGQPVQTGYEAKIAWLRQLMDWQKEISEGDEPAEKMYAQVFDDCVYVFTPQGDVLELQKGATPLDFAYHIHTSLGHRCRGGKVNGQIVPLTYHLQTGEYVEILTAKEEHPSRDWLNPHLGYLKTARAKAKVLHWFRQQNLEQNLAEGHMIVEKEIRRLGIKGHDLDKLALQMKYQSPNELYIALGRGDITLGTFLHHLQGMMAPAEPETEEIVPITPASKTEEVSADIEIEGVGNLLTHIALCCKPIPGDSVLGYITQGHGVSIHRSDCSNITNTPTSHKARLIPISWGVKTANKYVVDLVIDAYDRQGLIRDITQLLLNEHLPIMRLECSTDKKEHTARIHLSIEVQGLNSLSKALSRLTQVANVMDVKRV